MSWGGANTYQQAPPPQNPAYAPQPTQQPGYAPAPQQGYGAPPQQGYGAPPQRPGAPPQSGYAPVAPQYGAPPQQPGAPPLHVLYGAQPQQQQQQQPSYRAPPPQQYGSAPPPQQYGSAPPQNPAYRPAQPAYGAPPQNPYGAAPPQQTPYGAPPQNPYGAAPPQQTPYGAPPQNPYGAPQQHPGVQSGANPELMHWFQTVDRDRSGKISAEELQQALVNGNWTHFNLKTCQLMIGMFDKNKNGVIDFYEFEALWKYLQEWRASFERFDHDRSGAINAMELQNAFQTFGFNLSPNFSQLCVRLFDKTRHSAINLDDFILCCVMLNSLTSFFRSKDTQMKGAIQMNYEEFIKVVLDTLIPYP